MALPATVHLSCRDCDGTGIAGDGFGVGWSCEACGGFGHQTFGVVEMNGELVGWHYEAEQFVAFDNDQAALDGHFSRAWAFAGTVLERRVLDQLGIPHGTSAMEAGHSPRLVAEGGSWVGLVRWQDAIARAKGGVL